MTILNYNDLLDYLESIAKGYADVKQQPQETQVYQPKVFQWQCPQINRVTFNGNTTVVWFVDGSKCIVECSTSDKYDKKTAIVYAIVKRMMGKLGAKDKNGIFRANLVDGNGFGTFLQKVVDSSFDQQLEEKLAAKKKLEAQEKHAKTQEIQQQAAFKKHVEERAKQILIERAAIDRANQLEDEKRSKKVLNETCSCSGSSKTCSCKTSSSKKYVRPDKPFSQFTVDEKREYWREHNKNRKKM